MAITLNQLLKKSYHGELKCVAGHKGLDKEILGVNVVDNPEIVSWLYGGELILSTGYVTKNNPSMLNTLVKDLHRKNYQMVLCQFRNYQNTNGEKLTPQIKIFLDY